MLQGGTTSSPRCNLTETTGLDGMGEPEVDPTQLDHVLKPQLRRPPGSIQNDFWLVRPIELESHCNDLRCRQPNRVRPEGQFSGGGHVVMLEG